MRANEVCESGEADVTAQLSGPSVREIVNPRARLEGRVNIRTFVLCPTNFF